MPAVVARDLSKTYRTTVREPGVRNAIRTMVPPRYRDHVAVQDVSFEVAAGELVVLLGPNGAGKSTLIKMLTGLRKRHHRQDLIVDQGRLLLRRA